MIDNIQRILHKLAYLRQHEDFDGINADAMRSYHLQWIRHHRYQLPPPLSETELTDFEARNDCRLPDDYRLFLLDVSAGGVGPGDMVDFRELLELEHDTVTADAAGEFDELNEQAFVDKWFGNPIWFSVFSEPFPLTAPSEDVTQEDFFLKTEQEDGIEEAWGLLHYGQLYMSHRGCWCCDLLVVTGDERGHIWTMDGDDWHPVRHQAGKLLYHVDDPAYHAADALPVTFAIWYEAWLDEQIDIAYPHWQKRGRDVPAYEELQS